MSRKPPRSRLMGSTVLAAAVALPGAPGAAQPVASPIRFDAPACPARPGWTQLTPAAIEADKRGRVVNWIAVRPGGAVSWNGAPIPRADLERYLMIVATMRPPPATVVLRVPGAGCAEVADVAALVEAGVSCAATGACIMSAGPEPAFRLSPAPPAPPPPSSWMRQPPNRSAANLATYLSIDDYPAEALRNGEEGMVGFRLDVGADGRVRRCTVTSSSGSTLLDETTCRLMTERPRFTPARDATGRAVDDSVSARVRWQLPPPEPAAPIVPGVPPR